VSSCFAYLPDSRATSQARATSTRRRGDIARCARINNYSTEGVAYVSKVPVSLRADWLGGGIGVCLHVLHCDDAGPGRHGDDERDRLLCQNRRDGVSAPAIQSRRHVFRGRVRVFRVFGVCAESAERVDADCLPDGRLFQRAVGLFGHDDRDQRIEPHGRSRAPQPECRAANRVPFRRGDGLGGGRFGAVRYFAVVHHFTEFDGPERGRLVRDSQLRRNHDDHADVRHGRVVASLVCARRRRDFHESGGCRG